jgi:hypothetical protein
MNKTKRSYIQLLIGISGLAILFHILILTKVIPYSIAWGGRLKSDQEMYVFEFISIFINAFFVFVLLQKGELVKPLFSAKALSIILWAFFVLFVLNTIGNIFAQTNMERFFTLLTLLNAVLIWRISTSKNAPSNYS